MEIVKTLIWVLNLISAVAVIVLVLMQHGKGADMGATFGGGASSSGLFGSSGSANFLSRTTAICAVIFFTTCMGLVYLSVPKPASLGVMSAPVEAPVSGVVPPVEKAKQGQIPD